MERGWQKLYEIIAPPDCKTPLYTNLSKKRTMYQRKVDVDMLNAVKSMLADVSSVSPSSLRGEKKSPVSLLEIRGNFTQHTLSHQGSSNLENFFNFLSHGT